MDSGSTSSAGGAVRSRGSRRLPRADRAFASGRSPRCHPASPPSLPSPRRLRPPLLRPKLSTKYCSPSPSGTSVQLPRKDSKNSGVYMEREGALPMGCTCAASPAWGATRAAVAAATPAGLATDAGRRPGEYGATARAGEADADDMLAPMLIDPARGTAPLVIPGAGAAAAAAAGGFHSLAVADRRERRDASAEAAAGASSLGAGLAVTAGVAANEGLNSRAVALSLLPDDISACVCDD
mmetsp:Transcript_6786/g.21507  ORF Transcript_6786/g.21507 Transcript_6786/m.21507 type:complete len:239 (-) Transcript_6786:56-772(-)